VRIEPSFEDLSATVGPVRAAEAAGDFAALVYAPPQPASTMAAAAGERARNASFFIGSRTPVGMRVGIYDASS
jgi:hypothetical protein